MNSLMHFYTENQMCGRRGGEICDWDEYGHDLVTRGNKLQNKNKLSNKQTKQIIFHMYYYFKNGNLKQVDNSYTPTCVSNAIHLHWP
jgi:hypothetical protein